MQPNTRGDSFKPKWRHFHPQARVWVLNPFNHDVEFKVADDYNNQYTYKMPANSTSELPGGMIATLGLKAIIDEMIQNNSEDLLRIWDEDVRKKYEDQVIQKVKEAPENRFAKNGPAGEIDLGVKEDDNDEPQEIIDEAKEEEKAFPALDDAPPEVVPAFTSDAPQVIEED